MAHFAATDQNMGHKKNAKNTGKIKKVDAMAQMDVTTYKTLPKKKPHHQLVSAVREQPAQRFFVRSALLC